MANVFQHEIDHLDGILYIDKMNDISSLKDTLGYATGMAQKAYATLTREEEAVDAETT